MTQKPGVIPAQLQPYLQAEGDCVHGGVEGHTPAVTLLLNHIAQHLQQIYNV
jgi:hypothetical protein